MSKRFFIGVFIFSACFLILAGCKNNSGSDSMVFYYSLTCPHCKNVEKYIVDNNVKDKVKFEEKEVSGNKENAADFGDKISKCGIKPEEAGVPLFWDGSACLVGDQQIINYFFTKINEK